MSFLPRLLTADKFGRIVESPTLLMYANRGGRWHVPDSTEMRPLPRESELFLLPGRLAVGYNPRTKKREITRQLAVAAFAAPGYALSGHPAYIQQEDAPMLPLFAYGACGYASGKIWICAQKVDDDPRQQFYNIRPEKIEREANRLLRNYPHNRLVRHIINNCVRRYACPAARNFALGRYEAPLPTSRACNARCVGCISQKQPGSPIEVTPQCRLEFIPTSGEIVEVMRIHGQREKNSPIYSFGQGCEGDPLANAPLLAESIKIFRDGCHNGTINCNSNASDPAAVGMLADAGLTSLRVSLNSARPELYEAYYRPVNYNFEHVRQSICAARRKGVYVSLNLLYFPGVTDTLAELEALGELCSATGVSMIQWRNLNIDPLWYMDLMAGHMSQDATGSDPDSGNASMGLAVFMRQLAKKCPWLRYGYFNPYLGNRAVITAPEI